MKKLLSLVVMLLTFMTMMAEPVRIDFSQAPSQQDADKVIWQMGNLTFTLSKGTSDHDANEYVTEYGLKMYKDQVMTISSTNGSIQKATFKDSPMEPGPTPPTFSVLQNCTAKYGWDTVLTAETGGCTSMGGTLSAYSHIIWVDIETGITGQCGDDLMWTYANGTLTITGTGDMWDYNTSTMPWKEYKADIKKINLPDALTSISEYAFANTQITEISIPDGVRFVERSTFDGCKSLTKVKLPAEIINIGSVAFYGCTSLKEIQGISSAYNLRVIEESAFYGCSSLKEVTFPTSLETIGNNVFTDCTSLESININGSVTRLGIDAFTYCTNLKNVVLNAPIATLGSHCFSCCTSLEVIDLPATITSIGNQAFYNCSNLKKVICRATTPPTLGELVFYMAGTGEITNQSKNLKGESARGGRAAIQGVIENITLYVPAESIPLYKAAEGWKDFSVVDDVKNFNDNGGDTPIDPNDKVGRPMEPIKPDLNQYTHKMMVLGAPWGIEDLCMAILRDNDGRVVQKMTMRIDGDNLSAHMTDSVRTYTYEDNKMIEDLAVPYYDENDVLHMEKIFRTTTSYYRLAEGHREVIEKARFEHDEYVASGEREEYIFDSEGRKVSYKKYYGDELEAELDYTYDENGGCLGRGKYDGYSNYSGYTRYDENGNLRGKTEWGTYYEYFYDNQNHYQGYKYYYDYNFDDHTYGKVHDDNYFEILETYADGSAKKMKRKGDGEVRTFSRAGNVETQINTPTYGSPVTITRTFDDQGRIVAKTSTNRTFKSNYIYSDLSANQVLGAVNTFDEDLHTNYQETVNWTYSNPLSATSYEYTFWGIDEKAFTTYNIVPLSVLPAQTTEEGVAISVGNAGDKVVLSNEGEIYLLDKGGKKRYSVSVSGINVSSEGGKIVVTGWTPISFAASAKGVRKASETIDLTTNEYDIYIPEDVITINGKSLNEVYLPISLDENGATGIVEVKNDVKSTTTDGRLYNLQGIQVKTPEKGQIVIINGKKVVVK